MKINTNLFKSLLAKVSKGAGNNGDFAITQMVKIKATKKEGLELVTTDLRNTLKVKESDIKDDIEIVVVLDKLNKLISKTTTEEVELKVEKETLKIKGNGNYTIPIETTEDGKVPKMYEPEVDKSGGVEEDVDILMLKELYKRHKAVLPKGSAIDEYPSTNGIYIGEEVVSTNGSLFTTTNVCLLDNPILLTPELFDLIQLIGEERADVLVNKNKIKISTNNIEILGTLNDLIEDFPLESIKELNKMEFEGNVSINTDEWLSAIDRLSLFIGVHDNNEIKMNFSENKVELSTKNGEGLETIDIENVLEFNCLISVLDLKTQLQNLPKSATLCFGEENCIKLETEDTTMIVALSYDDEQGE